MGTWGWKRAALGVLASVGLALSAGCATTGAAGSDETRVQTLSALCQGGSCSCEKQCELDFLTCPFREGVCATGNALCRQNCTAGMQASYLPARSTTSLSEED